jgi:coatomer subunit beta
MHSLPPRPHPSSLSPQPHPSSLPPHPHLSCPPQLSSSPTALKSAAAALVALLVDHSDNNVRLVTLDRLILLKQKHPLVLQGMVLDLCRVLQAPSPDIRSRSLALITELVTSSNVDNVLGSLKKELSSRSSDALSSDAEFKATIVSSLVVLTSNFPDTATTISNTLLDLITDAGSVAVDSMQGVRELIAVFPEIRSAATQRLRDVIGSVRQGKVLRIVVACLAEFSVGPAAIKASLDETFAMIGPLPLQVLDASDSKSAVSHDRPKVLADGSYASQASIVGGEGGLAACSRHPLVVSLLQGEYSVGLSIASSLSKLLVLYKNSGSSDQAEVSRLCVNMILLCSSVMRLTKVDGSKGMDSDSVEKLCSIMSVLGYLLCLNRRLKHSSGLLFPTAAATSFSSNGSPPAPSCTVMSCR